MPTREDSQRNTDLADRVRSILQSKNLSLSQVSERSAERFGRASEFFVSRTLYHQLRLSTFSPSLQQIFALGQISGYRFSDWLRVFGFDPEHFPTLQISLPSHRTTVLDSSWVDSQAWVPRLRSRDVPVPPIAPLTQLLELSSPARLGPFSAGSGRFLYAKIGSRDDLAFPDLLPGSIVRVRIGGHDDLLARANGTTSQHIFLIEHSRGLFCCRLRSIRDNVIVPVSTLLSFAQIELSRPQQVRVIGVVDFEIRPLGETEPPVVPRDLAKHWKPHSLTTSPRLAEMLRTARVEQRRSLREAASLSHRIAGFLQDDRYIVSASSLCDYELLGVSPRDFHKSITLCLTHGLNFRTFLSAIGLDLQTAGSQPMPDHFVSRALHASPLERAEDDTGPDSTGFLGMLLPQVEEIPFFLRDSVDALSGLEETSLDNYFWIGGQPAALNPYLVNGLLVLVNRRRKRPIHHPSQPVWQQPVYLLTKRDGSYLCACCGIENGTMVVHPYSQRFHRSERFRYHHDAEVVGQIVAVARKLM